MARLVLALFVGFPASAGATSTISPSATVVGEIRAIEVIRDKQTPERKEAVVRLSTGEVVRAYVPAACVIVEGQTATLWRYDRSGTHFYVVSEPRESKAK